MKKKKNPNQIFHIETFINLFANAIVTGDAEELSNVLVYKNGEDCFDCKHRYFNCTCEGARVQRHAHVFAIGDPCEECELNYCLCDYDIDVNDPEQIRKLATKLAIENLTKVQLKELQQVLLEELKRNKMKQNETKGKTKGKLYSLLIEQNKGIEKAFRRLAK